MASSDSPVDPFFNRPPPPRISRTAPLFERGMMTLQQEINSFAAGVDNLTDLYVKPVDTGIFPACQPLISFVRSAMSISVIEFEPSSLSIVLSEFITVVWSRLKIFPICGRDISVSFRIR